MKYFLGIGPFIDLSNKGTNSNSKKYLVLVFGRGATVGWLTTDRKIAGQIPAFDGCIKVS